MFRTVIREVGLPESWIQKDAATAVREDGDSHEQATASRSQPNNSSATLSHSDKYQLCCLWLATNKRVVFVSKRNEEFA